MESQINLALVGLGHVAKYQIDAIKQIDAIHLVAACDKEPGAAKIVGKGVRFFEQFDELLACDNIEVVLISTPTSEHYSMGLKVIEAGKGLLLEKPAAESNLELRQLVDASREKNVFMSVALHATFGMEVIWFLRCVNGGTFGSGILSGFAAEFYDPYVQNGAVIPAAKSLVDSWTDSGINALSVVGLFVNPALLEITDSQMLASQQSGSVFVQSSVRFKYLQSGNYLNGTIDTSWTLGKNYKVTKLFYDNGEKVILLDHSAQGVKLIERSTEKIIYQCENKRPRLLNHYIGLFLDFIRLYKEGENNLDFAESIHALLYRAKEIGVHSCKSC
jgi:D-galactose 1-dehydrogenase